MKIEQKQGYYNLLITKDELINIWASCLYVRSQNPFDRMPNVDGIIKTISKEFKLDL